jgi:triosephosphate isomerase
VTPKPRVPFICGNWKMHKTIEESVVLAAAIRNALGSMPDVEVAVAPVFTALHAVAKSLEGSQVAVAAQNCFWKSEGAFTGEVAPKQLVDVGCRYVILGHSERRQLFDEANATIHLKLQAALTAGLRPILCVGEIEAERDAGETFSRIDEQLASGLFELTPEDLSRVTIAYEPVWAIGTGRTATPAQAEEVHAFIRGHLVSRFGEVASTTRIQYGGSVKPENARALLEQPNIDGALVGGASLKADDFSKIVKYRQA